MPTDSAHPSDFDEIITLDVSGVTEIVNLYGPGLATNGLFLQRDVTSPVGALVLLRFMAPNKQLMFTVSARVIHARPALNPNDKTAGIALELLDFDAAGRTFVNSLKTHGGLNAPNEPEVHTAAERVLIPTEKDPRPVVGIDLGTTYSCIAAVVGGQPKVLATSEGYETVPSVIYVGHDGKVIAGHRAFEKMVLEPARCIYGAKRFLGRRFASKEVHAFGHFFHYQLTAAKSGFAAVQVDNTALPLELVAAHVLAHLRQCAQLRLGQEVVRAIITVPAYFGETQRQAVREAGRLAGFSVERLLNEPTAAAVAYGFGRGLDRKVLVYDFGGGTFDATVMHIQGDTMEVLATDGDPFLGGADLDDRLTEYVLTMLERVEQKKLRHDAVAVQRLRFAAEAAKRELSETESTNIRVPNLSAAGQPPFNVAVPITRDLFERLIEDLVNRSLSIVQRVLDQAHLKGSDLHDIVMVGGQSRSPIIRRLLTERFGKQPTRGAHPDHAIALGAAIVATAHDTATPITLKDILAKPIRLGFADGHTDVLLPAGAPLPASKEFTITTGPSQEFRVTLYRGEGASTTENELLGELKMPSSLSLAVTKTPAKVTVTVDQDGLLTAKVEHPLTKKTETVSLTLPEGIAEAEALDIIELTDVVA